MPTKASPKKPHQPARIEKNSSYVVANLDSVRATLMAKTEARCSCDGSMLAPEYQFLASDSRTSKSSAEQSLKACRLFDAMMPYGRSVQRTSEGSTIPNELTNRAEAYQG